jgi:hypothetical protein
MRTTSNRLLWTGLLAAPALALALGAGVPALADDDDDEGGRGSRVAAPLDPRYAEECGACHVPYPAWALPARSWDRIMTGLSDHFGDNAELAPDTAAAIGRYLKANAADTARSGEARELGAARGDAPLRITELPGFKKEHREAAARAMKSKPDLKLSQCDACHTQAAQGSYRESQINVPGVGRWED